MNKNEINQVKFLKNGGLAVDWSETKEKKGEAWVNEENQKKSDLKLHPDLLKCFKSFAPFIATVLGVDKLPEKELKEWKKDISITGISVSGKEMDGVVISCTYETENRQKIAINTPRIVMTDNVYGFEVELDKCVHNFLIEVEEYIVNEKSSQMKLEMDDAA